jgi:hypothetical protein
MVNFYFYHTVQIQYFQLFGTEDIGVEISSETENAISVSLHQFLSAIHTYSLGPAMGQFDI